MNNRKQVPGIIFVICVFLFISMFFLMMFQKDVNYNDGNSTLVQANVIDYRQVSTTTINNKVTYEYKLYVEYIIDGSLYKDDYNCSFTNNYVPETVTIYVNNETKLITIKSNMPINIDIIGPIAFVIIFIGVTVIVISSVYKKHNGKNIQFSNSTTEPKNDDPFSKDNCKYNIDKDDPFSDFYNKSK